MVLQSAAQFQERDTMSRLIDLVFTLRDYDDFIPANIEQHSPQQSISNDRSSLPPSSVVFSPPSQTIQAVIPTADLLKPLEPRIMERVRVKSSAHVSFIVGKQGGKIRDIRNHTDTYIQTPVNGEDPVFIVKGTRSNVYAAKREILKESADFDLTLFAEALNYRNGEEKQKNLYLPSRYIGLVVGKNGNVIKRIVEESGAKIVTPKVNSLNGFKIYGSEETIRCAVEQIKNHITSTCRVMITETNPNQFEITLKIEPITNGATNRSC